MMVMIYDSDWQWWWWWFMIIIDDGYVCNDGNDNDCDDGEDNNSVEDNGNKFDDNDKW